MLRKNLKLVILIIYFVSLTFFYLRQAKQTPLHGDEMTFIGRGEFLDLYLKGDFKNELWQGFDSYEVPKLMEYFYGFSTMIYGRDSIDNYLRKISFTADVRAALFKQWPNNNNDSNITIFSYDYKEPIEDQFQEPQISQIKTILFARTWSVLVFSIPAFILLFLVGRQLFGNTWALILTIMFSSHQLTILCFTRAMSDNTVVFFSLLFVHLLIRLLNQHQSLNKTSLSSSFFLIGIISGLATATKLNGGINVLILMFILSWLKHKNRLSWRYYFFFLFSYLLAAFVVFFLINPFVWTNTTNHLWRMLECRIKTSAMFQQKFSNEALLTLGQRATRIFQLFFSLNNSYSIFGSIKNFLYSELLLLIWAFKSILKKNQQLVVSQQLILIWAIGFLLITSALIPLSWDRYFLPILLSLSIVEIFGLKHLILDCHRYINKK